MNIISKFGTIAAGAIPHAKAAPESVTASPALSPTTSRGHGQPMSSWNSGVLSVSGTLDTSHLGQSDAQLKRQALEALVDVLRSLSVWGTAASVTAAKPRDDMAPPPSARSQTGDLRQENNSLSALGSTELLRIQTPEPSDDPGRFESAKQRKTTLLEGIRKFNYKPKKVRYFSTNHGLSKLIVLEGIQFLIENGFIPSKDPKDVATFLFNTEGLNKAILGEYLGEG